VKTYTFISEFVIKLSKLQGVKGLAPPWKFIDAPLGGIHRLRTIALAIQRFTRKHFLQFSGLRIREFDFLLKIFW